MVAGGKLRPGTVVDERFVLEQRLGAGATGVVWRVKDEHSGEAAALKILHPKMSHDAMAIGQLGREAEVLQQLDHANIARSFAFQPNPPIVYLAMELVDGTPLHLRIGERTTQRKYFTHREVLHMFEQLCAAVGYAHSKYIVHRDLKPHNVMVIGDGTTATVKVLDFGIARLLEGSIFDATTLGRQLGSLFYMSPEQTRGEPADARSDVFALGTILFELLTLRRTWAWDDNGKPIPAFERPVPHGEANALTAVFTRLTESPRPVASESRLEIPPLIDNIILRSLAIDPDDRYATVAEFSNEALTALKKITGSVDAPTELAKAVTFPKSTSLIGTDLALTTVADAAEQSFDGSTVIDSEISDIDAVRRAHQEQKLKPSDSALITHVPPGRKIPETMEYRGGELSDDMLDAPGPTVRAAAPNPAPSAAPRKLRDTRDTLPPPPVEMQPTHGVTPQAVTTPSPSARVSAGASIGLLIGVVMAAFAAAILVGTLLFNRDPPPRAIAIPPPEPVPSVRFPELWAQLKAVKANPADDAARNRMLSGITKATERVADPKEAESIIGCANGNAMMMNVQGLENCLRRLEQAAK